ncbi:lamin tail domain-containing protein [Neolewinella persica]|uniref:lamin tail domain-containing protein n=1 Tax=Neolewinella persica TaxID=70998 RepID=UPI00146F03E2|nr:lamin tail domain-containing protein [Neolewinella persica]
MPRLLFILVLVAVAVAVINPLQALPEADPQVEVACPVTIDPATAKYRCINGNQLTLRMPYLGVAPGASVFVTGPGSATVGGDDPAATSDGVIELIGLVPSSAYVLGIIGPGCAGPDAIFYNFTTPNYICADDLTVLINEVLPEPGSDTNDDGVVNFLEEQFVEVFNPDAQVEIDLNGWILIIGGTVRYTFPPATILGPRQALTVFGGGTLFDPCHYAPGGF